MTFGRLGPLPRPAGRRSRTHRPIRYDSPFCREGGTMSQDTMQITRPIPEQSTKRNREHYAELVDKYFEYAHSNRLEEVVATFTDDAFATFVVAPEPFS